MSDLKNVMKRLDDLDRARPCRGVLSTENMAFWAELDKHWAEIRAALPKA